MNGAELGDVVKSMRPDIARRGEPQLPITRQRRGAEGYCDRFPLGPENDLAKTDHVPRLWLGFGLESSVEIDLRSPGEC